MIRGIFEKVSNFSTRCNNKSQFFDPILLVVDLSKIFDLSQKQTFLYLKITQWNLKSFFAISSFRLNWGKIPKEECMKTWILPNNRKLIKMLLLLLLKPLQFQRKAQKHATQWKIPKSYRPTVNVGRTEQTEIVNELLVEIGGFFWWCFFCKYRSFQWQYFLHLLAS